MTNFAFSTKARTLETLARFEVEALLCEQVIIGHDDWTGRQAEVLSETARRFSGRLLAVRSSAMNEDGEAESLAGAFLSLTSVAADEATLERAIGQVFVSSPPVKYHLSVESLARALSCLGPGEGGYGCIV
jgi:hypothetical protein